jgi:hypothetical protein
MHFFKVTFITLLYVACVSAAANGVPANEAPSVNKGKRSLPGGLSLSQINELLSRLPQIGGVLDALPQIGELLVKLPPPSGNVSDSTCCASRL